MGAKKIAFDQEVYESLRAGVHKLHAGQKVRVLAENAE